jgi:hypothetical protein
MAINTGAASGSGVGPMRPYCDDHNPLGKLISWAQFNALKAENDRLLAEQGKVREAPTLQRIYEAHSYLGPDWPFRSLTLGDKHNHYHQSDKEACYICTLLKLVEAQREEIERLKATAS